MIIFFRVSIYWCKIVYGAFCLFEVLSDAKVFFFFLSKLFGNLELDLWVEFSFRTIIKVDLCSGHA